MNISARLGRRFALDYRDAKFLTREVVAPTRPPRKTWRLDARLDQGDFPHCVGYAWKHRILSAPVRSKHGDPVDFYNGAQGEDEFDGPPPPYDGTSVRGGAKYVQRKGHVRIYRWAFSTDDVLNTVGNEGPVVAGTDWTTSMFRPDAEGIIRANGMIAGGHAYLILGYDDRRSLALIHNSWGDTWGIRGRCWIPYEDLEELLRNAGEACCPVER